MSKSAARLSLKTVGLSLLAAFVSFAVGGLAMRAALDGKAADYAGPVLIAALVVVLAVAVVSLILFVKHWKAVGAANDNSQFNTGYAVIGASVLCATFGGCNGVLNSYSAKISNDSAVQASKRMEKAKEEGAKRKEAEAQRLAALSPQERAAEMKVAQDKADAQKKADEVRAKVRAQEEQQRAQEKLVGREPLRSDSDGTYSAVRFYLKDTMKDPDSLKMDGPCTDAVKTKAGWAVQCTYRGKNSFGAVVLETKWFVIQQNKVVAALDESPIAR